LLTHQEITCSFRAITGSSRPEIILQVECVRNASAASWPSQIGFKLCTGDGNYLMNLQAKPRDKSMLTRRMLMQVAGEDEQ
jgi:hypothetical protein